MIVVIGGGYFIFTQQDKVGYNLVPNAELKYADPDNPRLPFFWTIGNYGQNRMASFWNPKGLNGNGVLTVSLSKWHDGDAKYEFAPVKLQKGVWYQYSHKYRSTNTSNVTGLADNENIFFGSFPTTNNKWKEYKTEYYSTKNVSKFVIYRALVGNGSLSIADVKLEPLDLPEQEKPLYRPLVSLAFVNDSATGYFNDALALSSRGYPATFYVDGELIRDLPSYYQNATQIDRAYWAGNEIGLTGLGTAKLSGPELETRLNDTRTAMDIRWQTESLYGDFNNKTILQEYGYKSRLNTQTGYNNLTTDPYDIRSQIGSAATMATFRHWVNETTNDSCWLVIRYDGPVSQRTLANQLDYLSSKNMTVVPISHALTEIQAQLP